MTGHNGNTALIGQILDAAEDSLTTAQVVAELAKRGVKRSATQISSLLRNAESRGRFIRSEINGMNHWTNNPEWTPEAPGRKKQVAEPELSRAPSQALHALDCRVPQGTAVVSLGAGSISAHRPNPHNLVQRLEAIGQDLHDALEDACKARLPHELIAALAAANKSTQLAARHLVA